jgi:hypothetical protein
MEELTLQFLSFMIFGCYYLVFDLYDRLVIKDAIFSAFTFLLGISVVVCGTALCWKIRRLEKMKKGG